MHSRFEKINNVNNIRDYAWLLVYTAVCSVAFDITRPTVRITDSSLHRQTISVQSTAKDNPDPGATK